MAFVGGEEQSPTSEPNYSVQICSGLIVYHEGLNRNEESMIVEESSWVWCL